ncbi:MAG: hypothetical protein DYG89_49325 [Caldilinea sp. CFX5]|nr:hypothetical protein [Caldilinea sp. CFX5]
MRNLRSSLYGRAEAGYEFDALQRQAKLSRLWAWLTRRYRALLCMDRLYRPTKVDRYYYAGAQSIPLAAIRGSVGRCADFDAEFRPLGWHSRERWINIAVAHEKELALPAVDLVRVNDDYFVADGHHRVSVAKAHGQVTIDANVVEWQGAAPAEPSADERCTECRQETGHRPLLNRLVSVSK